MTTGTPLRRLPSLSLPAAPAGAPVSLRTSRREGTVLLLLHAADCERCLAYLHGLSAVQEGLADWEGRVLAVVPADLEAAGAVAASSAFPGQVLADPEGRCGERCGLQGGSLAIADQWGEVFHVEEGTGRDHNFPAPEEVVEWLRFIAIQCPECQGEAY